MSSQKFSDRQEVLTYRQAFARMWRDFIRDNYESPAHVAWVFKVDPATAQNWWEGLNAPQGWVVGRAVADPNTREAVLGFLGGGE